jgi:hypothetical protein
MDDEADGEILQNAHVAAQGGQQLLHLGVNRVLDWIWLSSE